MSFSLGFWWTHVGCMVYGCLKLFILYQALLITNYIYVALFLQQRVVCLDLHKNIPQLEGLLPRFITISYNVAFLIGTLLAPYLQSIFMIACFIIEKSFHGCYLSAGFCVSEITSIDSCFLFCLGSAIFWNWRTEEGWSTNSC